MRSTASSMAGLVRAVGVLTPPTLRTYWRAAARTSSSVAGGSRPRRVVMLRHTPSASRGRLAGRAVQAAGSVLATARAYGDRMARPTVVWWIRRDLRLRDNPALSAAADAGKVVALFVLDDALWNPSGDARRAFLVGALEALDRQIGGHLVVRRGTPAEEVARLAGDVEATAVYAAADFGPYGRQRDDDVESALSGAGVDLHWTGSPYAVEPGTILKGDDTPFKVFTPFSRAWAKHGWDEPVDKPARVSWVHDVAGVPLPAAPAVDADLPAPGEDAALERWADFRDGDLDDYATERDVPAADRTSRMSAYLRWGCVHPRTLLAELDPRKKGHATYRSELAWREFYADVLWHRPDSARHSLQAGMAAMKVDGGRQADERFAAWAAGRTGYPIVDAGMRQLLAEGWMHNRLRMITASFLVKDLHLDWTRGARWFMQHLVDGDLASNNHGWQWVAGTGTDAAPYFRIFNPTTQGERFDPQGDYVRRWVPELGAIAGKAVHDPWASGSLPLDAGDYPEPIVDHKAEREEALGRYQATRS
jgi:deoxyribodipyrimidine photo-lyase